MADSEHDFVIHLPKMVHNGRVEFRGEDISEFIRAIRVEGVVGEMTRVHLELSARVKLVLDNPEVSASFPEWLTEQLAAAAAGEE